RALQAQKTFHLPNMELDPEFGSYEISRLGGYRAVLGTPLMREGAPIGVMMCGRRTARAFTDKQIEVANTFADQAVIAIENVRLFRDVQERTAELSEALEQQTATAELLRVISRSSFDLQALLDSLVETATHLCDVDGTNMWLPKDGRYQMAASFGLA